MAGTKSQVKNDQVNIFKFFNFDEIIVLAKEGKCPICGKVPSRFHPIKHSNGKVYWYAEHRVGSKHTLHYIVAHQDYDYVITRIKAIYFGYKRGWFSREQVMNMIYDIFQLVTTEAKADPEFRKVIKNSLRQLLELLETIDKAEI